MILFSTFGLTMYHLQPKNATAMKKTAKKSEEVNIDLKSKFVLTMQSETSPRILLHGCQ